MMSSLGKWFKDICTYVSRKNGPKSGQEKTTIEDMRSLGKQIRRLRGIEVIQVKHVAFYETRFQAIIV